MGKHGEAISPKQEKFCLEYQKDGNAFQSAERAGYAGKYSELLVKMPNIQKRMAELVSQSTALAIVELKYTAKDAYEEIQLVQDLAMKSIIVDGKDNAKYMAIIQKGIDMKTKLLGLNAVEKKEVKFEVVESTVVFLEES